MFSYPLSICSMLSMTLVPFADNAAINSEIPALISGDVIFVALRLDLKLCPITTAR